MHWICKEISSDEQEEEEATRGDCGVNKGHMLSA